MAVAAIHSYLSLLITYATHNGLKLFLESYFNNYAMYAQCPRVDLKKSPYPDQRLPQHESLQPIGLKSARIEMPHLGLTN